MKKNGCSGRFLFGLLAYTLLFALSASAAEYKMIGTDELKDMFSEKKDFVLIDARTKDEYQEAHIKGAINIQEKDFDKSSTLLPAGKNALLVIYCNGKKCGKSKKTADKAAAAGFTNIAIYADGFPVWEEKNLPIKAGAEYGRKIETAKLNATCVKDLIASSKKDYLLVDVRDEAEFKEGHIPSAINIPVETFALKSDILPKEKKIVVYCNTGGRSYTAYRKLIKLAYPNIYQTTLAEWTGAGMALEK